MPDISVTESLLSTITQTTTRTVTKTIISTDPSSPISFTSPNHNTTFGFEFIYDSPPSLYQYSPSLPLAIIFTLLYFIQAIHHAYLSLYVALRPEMTSKHRYTIPLFVAATFSTLGYLIRCISIQKAHASDLSLFAASTALILISPIFICATLYLLLTRLVARHLLPPSRTTSTLTPTSPTSAAQPTTKQTFKTRIFSRPKLLSTLFLSSDIIAFLLQASGSAVAFAAQQNSTTPTTRPNALFSHGTHILLSGLILQLITFTLYTTLLHVFCLRVRNEPTSGFNPCIMQVVTATWIASGFLLVRNVFRAVEFTVRGPRAYPARHEWCLYVFEAVPVLASLVVLAWWHPVSWVQERKKGNGRNDGTYVVPLALAGRDHAHAHAQPGSGVRAHVRRRSRGVLGLQVRK